MDAANNRLDATLRASHTVDIRVYWGDDGCEFLPALVGIIGMSLEGSGQCMESPEADEKANRENTN